MKKLITFIVAATFVVSGTLAQEAPAAKDSTPIPQTATMLQVAGQLVKYGYAEYQALPLIQAADIYQTIGHRTLKDKPEQEQERGAASAGNSKKDSHVSFDPERILVDATEMAAGDPTLLTLIDSVRKNANRGATSDYEVTTEIVRANATDKYAIQFRGGETAIVVVSGDGDTDLDLYVYDADGNLVTSDLDNTDDCVCVWTPRYTSTYTIKIKNYGDVYNRYRIAVN